VMVAENGAAMTRFLSARHLASWPGSAPATTAPPASAVRTRPATAPNGSTSRSPKRRPPPAAPTTSTSPRAIPAAPAVKHSIICALL
jgi:hypothetical protein